MIELVTPTGSSPSTARTSRSRTTSGSSATTPRCSSSTPPTRRTPSWPRWTISHVRPSSAPTGTTTTSTRRSRCRGGGRADPDPPRRPHAVGRRVPGVEPDGDLATGELSVGGTTLGGPAHAGALPRLLLLSTPRAPTHHVVFGRHPVQGWPRRDRPEPFGLRHDHPLDQRPAARPAARHRRAHRPRRVDHRRRRGPAPRRVAPPRSLSPAGSVDPRTT